MPECIYKCDDHLMWSNQFLSLLINDTLLAEYQQIQIL
jgi:hypothetical protein